VIFSVLVVNLEHAFPLVTDLFPHNIQTDSVIRFVLCDQRRHAGHLNHGQLILDGELTRIGERLIGFNIHHQILWESLNRTDHGLIFVGFIGDLKR
jgi:hypothetical protein